MLMAQCVQARVLDLSMRESGSIEHGWGAGTRGEVGSGVGSLEKSKSPLDFVTAFLRSISICLESISSVGIAPFLSDGSVA